MFWFLDNLFIQTVVQCYQLGFPKINCINVKKLEWTKKETEAKINSKTQKHEDKKMCKSEAYLMETK